MDDDLLRVYKAIRSEAYFKKHSRIGAYDMLTASEEALIGKGLERAMEIIEIVCPDIKEFNSLFVEE